MGRAGRIILGVAVLLLLLAVAGAVAAGAKAPALTTRFVSERTSSPHPPDSLLAVGPSDLVDGSNAGIWFYSKAGRLQKQESWPQFWRRAGVRTSDLPRKCCVDPRAVWDRSLQRFWISMMAGTCGSCQDAATRRRGTSFVFLALSDTSGAGGSWHAVELDRRPAASDQAQAEMRLAALLVLGLRACDRRRRQPVVPDRAGDDARRRTDRRVPRQRRREALR
jgi:hypothetical protein